mgnify:CR=1 FL=1
MSARLATATMPFDSPAKWWKCTTSGRMPASSCENTPSTASQTLKVSLFWIISNFISEVNKPTALMNCWLGGSGLPDAGYSSHASPSTPSVEFEKRNSYINSPFQFLPISLIKIKYNFFLSIFSSFWIWWFTWFWSPNSFTSWSWIFYWFISPRFFYSFFIWFLRICGYIA